MNYLEITTKFAMSDLHAVNRYRKNFILAALAVRSDGSITLSKNILTEFPNPNAHAEKRVLAKAGMCVHTLYVVRITRHGEWALAKPCKHCHQLILNKRVNKVIYTVNPDTYQVWKPN